MPANEADAAGADLFDHPADEVTTADLTQAPGETLHHVGEAEASFSRVAEAHTQIGRARAALNCRKVEVEDTSHAQLFVAHAEQRAGFLRHRAHLRCCEVF